MTTWYAVAKTHELKPGELMYVEVGKNYEPVALVNLNGEFFALDDCCTHEDASLSDGTVDGEELECPLHGGAFDIRTGAPAGFPVVVAAKTYQTRVVGDDIQIGVG
jgi:3-phenylpropionate/trans-cinnamate dioxygenase ferredoxin component